MAATSQTLQKLIAARMRPLFFLLFCAAHSFMLTGCAKSPELPLRIAIISWPGYETLHLAQSLGYFYETQVRLVEMTNNSQSSHALRNGTVDAALLTLDELLSLMQDGIDLRVVLVMDTSNGADAVIARPEIANLQSLHGKRIAVETTAVGALMLDAMLTAGDMKAADINLIEMPVNEHVEAYQKGKIDAAVTFEPSRSQLLAQGGQILFDSQSIPGRIMDVLAVRAEVLPDHKQSLTALVAAHFKALDYIKDHPQEAAVRLAPFLGVSADQVLPQFAGLQLPDLAANHALLAGATPSLPLAATQLGELMLRRHLLHSTVAMDHLVDAGYLPESIK